MKCRVLDLGSLDYRKAWDLQKELMEKRFRREVPDTLILVEHPSVFTIGRSGSRKNLHVSNEYLESLGIPVYEIDRGGDITYHGPGQLMGYPILDLTEHGRDVHLLLRSLEEVLIRLLADWEVEAGRVAGYTGVWVGDEKIASIGIGVRHWISFHGFCLNVNPDMKYFSMISPCGIRDKGVTSLTKLKEESSEGIDLHEVKERLVQHFGDVFTVEMEHGKKIPRFAPSPNNPLPTCRQTGRHRKKTSYASGRLAPWLKKRLPAGEVISQTKTILRDLNLNTVCESAHCPNLGECFSRRTATFMILGKRCTRNCRFCAVEKGKPLPVDPDEPKRVAQGCLRLRLTHAVITSVTRDDLWDGGARQFKETIFELRRLLPEITIEILAPDFQGSWESLRIAVENRPHIFNHNLETVLRLYPEVRPQADYRRSLELLRMVKKLNGKIYTKSGLMVGLGETREEVLKVMSHLREVGCDFLTIGQYLAPSKNHLPVKEYILPETFDEYREAARELGFLQVASAPFVRSSYQAEEQSGRIIGGPLF
ncbi:lipoyl synthase [candidate division NPL-UPA2 bacterium]|nr:lipoyl synthase [candidate division NPL-UPA2 bacterium]